MYENIHPLTQEHRSTGVYLQSGHGAGRGTDRLWHHGAGNHGKQPGKTSQA